MKAASGRPAVWVEYNIPVMIEQAFWRKHIKRGDFDLLYFLNRPDTPIIPEITQVIEHNQVEWIDLHAPQLLGLSGMKVFQLLKILWNAIRKPDLTRMMRAMIFKMQLWHAAYLSVFQKRKVRLIAQHQDRSWSQAVQADAIEKAGGIMMGYHWSNLPYCPKDWFITAQHVYFVWGKTNYEAIMRKGNTCRHILPSGLWIKEDPLTDELLKFSQYSGFKIAVFDSNVAYDIYQSPKTLSDFFLAFLVLFEKYPDWKALFKFKFADVSFLKTLPEGDTIWSRVETLVKGRRIFVADPSLSPITAGKCADLSLCYVLNSAGICAQIRGAHAVHWDATGIRYPLIDQKGQKVIFPTLDKTMQAVEQFAAGDKSIGDLSRWRSLFDYFGDAKGTERIAGFIQEYMSAVIAQPDLSGLAISDQLSEKYLKQYHIGPEFFESFTFWT